MYKRDPNFRWAHAEEDYYEAPQFPAFYEQIKQLLEDENTLVFGHSVDNDLRYLASTLKRYKLKPYTFTAYDTQVMMNYFSEKRVRYMGLEKAFKALYSIDEFIKLQPHLSSDDALMTMRVVAKMSEQLEVTLQELILLTPGSKIDFANLTLKREETVTLVGPQKRSKKDKYDISKKAHAMWEKFYSAYTHLNEQESSQGKLITISAKVKQDITVLETVIREIKEQGLIPCHKISGTNYLIVTDLTDRERLFKAFKRPYTGRVITLDEFITNNK